MLKRFVLLENETIEYFCYNSKISVLCTFLMGKSSPYYTNTLINNEGWDINRPDLIGIEPLLDLIDIVYKYDESHFKKTNEVNYFSNF